MRKHPYAEAVYEAIPLAVGSFGVKVSISNASSATVSSFDSVGCAEAWVTAHKGRVQTNPNRGASFAD